MRTATRPRRLHHLFQRPVHLPPFLAHFLPRLGNLLAISTRPRTSTHTTTLRDSEDTVYVPCHDPARLISLVPSQQLCAIIKSRFIEPMQLAYQKNHHPKSLTISPTGQILLALQYNASRPEISAIRIQNTIKHCKGAVRILQ